MRYLFDAELWLWSARSDTWTFVSLPLDVSEEIRELAGETPRGFGSVPVTVTIGATTWQTSIFPEPRPKGYVLPVKKAVRRAEGVEAGDPVTVKVELRLG